MKYKLILPKTGEPQQRARVSFEIELALDDAVAIWSEHTWASGRREKIPHIIAALAHSAALRWMQDANDGRPPSRALQDAFIDRHPTTGDAQKPVYTI